MRVAAMRWIHEFQLFLFDFDGLLVNSEEIHYMAYKRMLAARGVTFGWTFDEYCQVAHYSSDGLRVRIYDEYPILREQEPSWDVLYNEKKVAIFQLLNEGAIQLMPGVEKLLTSLEDAGIKRCVVTHSPDELVAIVRRKHPILNTIPHWITREHYSKPKPDPECYLKAVEIHSRPGDKVIGFEDTPRGLRALMATQAKPVLICEAAYPEIAEFKKKGVLHFPTFSSIPDDQSLGG